MAPDLLWSILCPTLSSRQGKFLDLMGVLLPQCEAHGSVEVVALHNDGERDIAEYRQALLEDARGEYVSFVDDDDMVEPDFVTAITEAMRPQCLLWATDEFLRENMAATLTPARPDFIALRVAYYENGRLESRPTITGLQHDRWHDTDVAMIRDITHINPVRSALAKQADFGLRYGDGKEDWSYRSQMRHLLKTQAEIPRVLYHYRHDSGDSVQFGLKPHAHAPRPAIGSPAFRWHEWSTG